MLSHLAASEDQAKKVKRSMTLNRLSSEQSPVDQENERETANAERDLHRLFQKAGLSLPIPVRKVVHNFEDADPLTFEHVDPSAWLSLLIEKYPCILAGGERPISEQLAGFWELYRHMHPSHVIFQQHASELHKVWPLCFFGDEGRGPRRAVYMEGTIECPLGLWEKPTQCDCTSSLQDLPVHWLPSMPEVQTTPNLDAVKHICSNYKGHSFLKRYLCFSLPGYLYVNRPEIVQKHLEEVAGNLADLFTRGVTVRGVTYFAALIGSKGDMKFQKEIAFLTRCYAHISRGAQSTCMCNLCHAGLDQYPMEDAQFEPSWRHSLFLDRPWDESSPPPLTVVPYDDTMPEFLYKIDFFHCFKVGLGRDIAGSTLAWLAGLGAWDSEGSTKNLPHRLIRAHAHFRLWAQTNHKNPSLRSFSKAYLNIKSSKSSPWCNSKGSDTVLILEYLRFYVGLLVASPEWATCSCLDMLKLCRSLLEHSLNMCSVIYKHNLFLQRDCASRLYLEGMVVLRAYKRLAKFFAEEQKAGFRLKPKYHAMFHLLYDLRNALKGTSPMILSPIIWACEQNEDHVGRVSKLSRVLATKNITLRLTQRYFLKTKALMRKHLASRKSTKLLK